MSRSSSMPVIITIGLIVVFAGAILFFIYRPTFHVIVTVTDMDKISVGDQLYMNGTSIGEVTKAELASPNNGKITVIITDKYKDFLNDTSVFTITSDRIITGRKCLQCKNCSEKGAKIESGHVFTGYPRWHYEVACLGQKMTDFWDENLKDLVLDSIETTGKMSQDAIKKLNDLKNEHWNDFQTMLEQLKQEVDQMTPELQKQFEELLKKEVPPAEQDNGST